MTQSVYKCAEENNAVNLVKKPLKAFVIFQIGCQKINITYILGNTIAIPSGDLNTENLLHCMICSIYSTNNISKMIEHIGNSLIPSNYDEQTVLWIFHEVFFKIRVGNEGWRTSMALNKWKKYLKLL